MLVLTRKAGEQIRIDDDIVVTVVQVEDGRVRLGIEAPPDIRILRQELLLGEVCKGTPRRRALASR